MKGAANGQGAKLQPGQWAHLLSQRLVLEQLQVSPSHLLLTQPNGVMAPLKPCWFRAEPAHVGAP